MVWCGGVAVRRGPEGASWWGVVWCGGEVSELVWCRVVWCGGEARAGGGELVWCGVV